MWLSVALFVAGLVIVLFVQSTSHPTTSSDAVGWLRSGIESRIRKFVNRDEVVGNAFRECWLGDVL